MGEKYGGREGKKGNKNLHRLAGKKRNRKEGNGYSESREENQSAKWGWDNKDRHTRKEEMGEEMNIDHHSRTSWAIHAPLQDGGALIWNSES
ncbi:hypothetical protein Zmor_024312 [Zophobas morio]|uniref:Uncharacterized protein n=1 Tax=Zophobas morio TaxID=2755281 RepID=A0AA38HYA4_9CUCU|nr:hypothetical protein Zmor_024312 [Zophobas morio]